MDHIRLDALISSHCDADHYGGLWDLINPQETHELDLTDVRVDRFFHAGVCWFTDGEKRFLGPVEDDKLTLLLEDNASLAWALQESAGHLWLQGEWGKFLKCVQDLDCPVQRLSYRPGQAHRFVPGFGPGESPATFKVLGPVEVDHNGKPALRSLGGHSQNTNGNSALLRLDYGRARILLTGDLNAASQSILLENYAGSRQELACDVAKACHHGSDDCSFEFLSTMSAA